MIRFALVGGLAGSVQLGLLMLFLTLGMEAIAGNNLAFLLSAQFNFALSVCFVWHDRDAGTRPLPGLVRRWLAFHVAIAGTALLNQTGFVVARLVLPDLPAAGLGIGVAAAANFLVQDRIVFRRMRPRPAGARPPSR